VHPNSPSIFLASFYLSRLIAALAVAAHAGKLQERIGPQLQGSFFACLICGRAYNKKEFTSGTSSGFTF